MSFIIGIHIPRDVTEEIVGLLDSKQDKATLRTCALISRPFVYPSRRILFSTVNLRNSDDVILLHQICTSNPEIPDFVQDLRITIPYYSKSHKYEDGIENILPVVLGMFEHLKSLTLKCRKDAPRDWTSLPTSLRLLFENLIKQPGLQALTLIHLRFPNNFPSALGHIPNLMLKNVMIPQSLDEPTRLQSEHLYLSRWSGDNWPFLDMPNIRQLATAVNFQNEFIQDAIDAGARSLEHIFIRSVGDPTFDLSTVVNLQRLSYEIPDITSCGLEDLWPAIIEALSKPHVRCRLQELDIGYVRDASNGEHLDRRFGEKAWTMVVKEILCDRSKYYPRLRKFTLYYACDRDHYLKINGSDSETEEYISSIIKENLPLLSANGIKSTKLIHKHPYIERNFHKYVFERVGL